PSERQARGVGPVILDQLPTDGVGHDQQALGQLQQELEDHGADPARLALARGYVEPTPVDPAEAQRCRAELGIAEDALVVGACGTVDWRKAPELFVRTAATVVEQMGDRDVHFVWLGGGADSPLADALVTDVAGSPVGERIHVVSETPDPMPWFEAMDVFTLPAREDAFPLVCLEAASRGVPVVCFDNGGMPEFIERSDGGVVVEYPDLAAFATAVVDLLRDEPRRREMGAAARREILASHTAEVAGPLLWDHLEPWVA
ncbi:MAG: glycosyltransferase family 4 protein, partial [Actinomycetota bacterium]